METLYKAFIDFGLSFALLLLLGNIVPRFPHLPWDIYLDKLGFKIYIPFISAILLAVLITYGSSFLKSP